MISIIGFIYFLVKAIRSDKSVGMAILYGIGGAIGLSIVGFFIGVLVVSILADVQDEYVPFFVGVISIATCLIGIYLIDRLFSDLSWSASKLKEIRDADLQNYQKQLSSGEVVKHISHTSIPLSVMPGDKVMIDNIVPADGFYRLTNDTRWEVLEGKLVNEYYVEKYKQRDGCKMEIDGDRMRGIGKGSRVWINDEPAQDGTYKKGLLGKVRVINGRIV